MSDVSSPSVDYSAGLDGGAATDIALAWPCLFQGKKAPFWTCYFLGLRLSFHLWQMRMLSDHYISTCGWAECGGVALKFEKKGGAKVFKATASKIGSENDPQNEAKQTTLKALEVSKIALSLGQAEPTYLDDELNDGPNLSDMICWTIWTSPDCELQSRNPQDLMGTKALATLQARRNSTAKDAAICYGL